MSSADSLTRNTVVRGHRASCGHSTNVQTCLPVIKSALNPQERNVLEDNPQDTKPSLGKNDPNFEVLVQLVSQLLRNKNCPLVFLLRHPPPPKKQYTLQQHSTIFAFILVSSFFLKVLRTK